MYYLITYIIFTILLCFFSIWMHNKKIKINRDGLDLVKDRVLEVESKIKKLRYCETCFQLYGYSTANWNSTDSERKYCPKCRPKVMKLEKAKNYAEKNPDKVLKLKEREK